MAATDNIKGKCPGRDGKLVPCSAYAKTADLQKARRDAANGNDEAEKNPDKSKPTPEQKQLMRDYGLPGR